MLGNAIAAPPQQNTTIRAVQLQAVEGILIAIRKHFVQPLLERHPELLGDRRPDDLIDDAP